ncbi:gamma-butyrobetaine hydroxylase-like domain-containing protein [Microbulbifer sp. SA54]|uniref:gamma-butyrobetaine hydroxylase-like domain-containing protein n=1 Tax=Microbulbifer sp. SA54 TaxID=3401577 RepID=UPI003AAE1D66
MTAPKKIRLNKSDKQLILQYSDGEFSLPAEYLRVYSPSAEVRGHGAGEGNLVSGKINVGIDKVAAAGRYALQIFFDDGHDSGIYTWAYLRELCEQKAQKWQAYLERLQKEGMGRDPDESPVKFIGG